MKSSFILLFLLMSAVALLANPVPYNVLSEMSFADNGDLILGLSSNAPYNYLQLQNIYIGHNGSSQQLPLTGYLSYLGETHFNVRTLMPDMVFNPLQDSLEIKYDFGDGNPATMTFVKWGNDFTCDINPLSSVQSYVFCYKNFNYTPFKENPPTPGTSPYHVLSRDTLKVFITDQNGNPVPNARVFSSLSHDLWLGFNYSLSDNNGAFIDTVYAGKCEIKVWNPQTDDLIYDQYYFLEPNVSTTMQVQINMTGNSDHIIPPVTRERLKVFPSPYNVNHSDAVLFAYDGKIKPGKGNYIKIYDAKGRYVSSVPISAKGTASWKPDNRIVSGIYFARLISENRILDTTTISILK